MENNELQKLYDLLKLDYEKLKEQNNALSLKNVDLESRLMVHDQHKNPPARRKFLIVGAGATFGASSHRFAKAAEMLGMDVEFSIENKSRTNGLGFHSLFINECEVLPHEKSNLQKLSDKVIDSIKNSAYKPQKINFSDVDQRPFYQKLKTKGGNKNKRKKR